MKPNYAGRIIGRRLCPCGCNEWFDVHTRSPHKVCLDHEHAAVYAARKAGRLDDHVTRRREKFAEMLAELVTAGHPLKHSQLMELCERTWKIGYLAGHRVGQGTSARRAKRQARKGQTQERAA